MGTKNNQRANIKHVDAPGDIVDDWAERALELSDSEDTPNSNAAVVDLKFHLPPPVADLVFVQGSKVGRFTLQARRRCADTLNNMEHYT